MLICRIFTAFFAAFLFATNISAGIIYGIFSHEMYTLFCIICGIVVSTFSMTILAIAVQNKNATIPAVVSIGTAIYFWTMTIVAQMYDHQDIIPMAFISGIYTILATIFVARILFRKK